MTHNIFYLLLNCFASTLFLLHMDMGLGFAGGSTWSPQLSSYDQHLTVELVDRYEIRSIATRGRAHTNEYVTEYIVQYSDDGQAWASYESQDGVDEVLIEILIIKKKRRTFLSKISFVHAMILYICNIFYMLYISIYFYLSK